ncbi:MCE family protein [bacterium]|nr:MCE family protein [bacterium]
MKKFDNMRVYAWLEFVIWLIIVAVAVFGFRYYHYQNQKQYKSYQIFMEDVDGLIVGSPVKFLGVQIGHVKNIQLISSSVYIKFVITQKGLVLPAGSIATVEASGLGGSKALEIYPPQEGMLSDKFINTKDPTRLGKVMSLFDDIFRELNAIFGTLDHASHQFDLEHGVPKNVVEPVDAYNGLIKFEKSVDKLIDADKRLMDSVKNKKEQNRSVEDEFEQSENNK